MGTTTATEIILHNLRGGSVYEVSVTAYTSSGNPFVLQEMWTTPDTGMPYM